MQQNNELEKLCNDVLDYGDLLLIANKSHGKTVSLMQLARSFKNLENTRVFIFEDFPKWINEFDGLAYFVVRDSDVTESEHVIDLEDYFLRHERTYTIKRGREIEEFLKENQSGIFLMQINDIERSAFFIYSIVQHFYRIAYLRAYKGYNKHENIVFLIEESQNVFDSSTISKKLFNRMQKIYSVARNLGLHFVMATQRLQDLNTKIRGRTRLLVGQISLDDYELKINRLLRHSKHRKNVLSLPKGVFLYTPNDRLISFSEFQQSGKPYQFTPKPLPTQPEPEPKPKGFLERIIHRLTKPIGKEEPTTYNIEREDRAEEYENEEDEDLLVFPEEFEDE